MLKLEDVNVTISEQPSADGERMHTCVAEWSGGKEDNPVVIHGCSGKLQVDDLSEGQVVELKDIALVDLNAKVENTYHALLPLFNIVKVEEPSEGCESPAPPME